MPTPWLQRAYHVSVKRQAARERTAKAWRRPRTPRSARWVWRVVFVRFVFPSCFRKYGRSAAPPLMLHGVLGPWASRLSARNRYVPAKFCEVRPEFRRHKSGRRKSRAKLGRPESTQSSAISAGVGLTLAALACNRAGSDDWARQGATAASRPTGRYTRRCAISRGFVGGRLCSQPCVCVKFPNRTGCRELPG